MNRLLPIALVLLAAGCSNQPSPTVAPAATPTLTKEQQDLVAEGKRLMGTKPKDFRVELVSAEFRYGKPPAGKATKPSDDKTPLVVVVRCSNGDDTLDTSGWSVSAVAKDEFGNRIAEFIPHQAVIEKTGEANDTHPIPPGTSATRTFVFERPIPKATSVALWVGVSFPKRPPELPSGVSLKITLPPAK